MFPLQIKKTIIDGVFDFIEHVDSGREFNPKAVQIHVWRYTDGAKFPHDGTVTRYFRMYNERKGKKIVVNTSKHRSLYRKEV